MQAAQVERFHGRWVALDQESGEVLADARNLSDLQEHVHQQRLRHVVIQRVPEPDEPIYVGLA